MQLSGQDNQEPTPQSQRLTLAQANVLTVAQFRRVFGNVVECCPDAAVALEGRRPFASVAAAAQAAADFLDGMPAAGQLRVLLLHPELAGRLARCGQLTAESLREQRGAGVLRLSGERAGRLQDLTARYRQKFGFPYVVCVREKSPEEIMNDLEDRVKHSRDEELYIGINEVKKICRLRLEELVSD